MKLTFLGASHEVTGSRFLLEANGKAWMIDYGMEQGADIYENAPLPIPASSIDGVFLTHAHIDHSGYLPLLYKQGFTGRIFATCATADLCKIMLLDSAHIQEMDAEWKNRKAQRSGRGQAEPLYTQEDALSTHGLFVPCQYQTPIPVEEGISIRFVDVGHLLGSASIEVSVTENGVAQKLVFSGDIGNLNQPLIRDPEYLTSADYVIMESTYGDRNHGLVPDYIAALAETLQRTFDRGGNVVIPSFAVGRTQEMLYFLRHIKQEGLVKGHDDFPVYVDSPLAIEATHVFLKTNTEYADEDTLALLRRGINPISFDDLKTAVSADQSKLINSDTTPKVIISASGMCDAGRIRHHLKHNLWRPESTILFVGYQSMGTLGRSLVDGAKEVKIFGELIEVRASIEKLAGVSGHADQNGLLKWINSFQNDIRRVFVVHGEDAVAERFAAHLRDALHYTASAPYNGESWDLSRNEMLQPGNRIKLEKPSRESAALDKPPSPSIPIPATKGTPSPKAAPGTGNHHSQLQIALSKLESLVHQMNNASKKDLQSLTNQINILIRKFSKRKQ